MKISRQVWPTQVGSFLVSIGLLTGLANMAFFPTAICQQGISGNFITVYLICVIFIGFPITYLHLCLGQYSGCNPIDLFSKLCPAFKGIGWSWLILTVPMLIISNMNSTWALYYTHIAGQSIITGAPLPWTFHDKIFLQQAREVKGSMIEFVNRMAQETNKSQVKPLSLRHPAEISPTTPDYFHHLYHTANPELILHVGSDDILRILDKKIVLGPMQTNMVTFLALAWVIVSLCTIHNSVNTMNRIAYVTATLPLLILAILLIRVIYLPGAWQGMALLIPTTHRITESSVWQAAIKLIFFDMQIGVGVLISISKHNRFHNNIYRDALLLVVLNVVINLLCACLAFGYLGFLAYNLDEDDVRSMCRGQTGPHLIWDQILRSMSFMKEGAIFSFLYQLMVGMGSIECSFTLCEYFSSALDHKIPRLKNRSCILRAFVSIFMFMLTLPCCFQSGVHIYNLLVYYSMHWNVKIMAICQFIVIVFFYGIDNLLSDIRFMLRLPTEDSTSPFKRFIGPTGYFVRHLWMWICPTIIALTLLLDAFTTSKIERAKKVGDSYLWNIISTISIFPLLSFIYYFYIKDRTAFRSDKWRNLKMPIDESTISNAALSPPMELDTIFISDKSDSTYKRPSPNYPVNFVLNNSSYFISPNASTVLLDQSDQEIKNESVKADNNPSQKKAFLSFSELTGQPSFI